MKVLVVAAHPDDEVLGCGGTLALHADHGDEVAALFMTDGVGARGEQDAALVEERREAMWRAARILGIGRIEQRDFPDNAMDRVSLLEIARSIEVFCSEWGYPDLVFTHHPGDLNIDHELTHRAVLTAFRPLPGSPVREIRTFEVLSSTEWRGTTQDSFHPNIFVDISSTLERKMEALEAYSAEMRSWPHARSIDAVAHLAALSGASVGYGAAERFSLERRLLS